MNRIRRVNLSLRPVMMARWIVPTGILVLEVQQARGFVAPTTTLISMSSAPRDRPRILRSYEKPRRPPVFQTVSASGESVEAAFRVLEDKITVQGIQECSTQPADNGSSIGLVFYTEHKECDKGTEEEGDADARNFRRSGDVQEAVGRLHRALPFVENVLGERIRYFRSS